MAELQTLSVKKREGLGKGSSRRLRIKEAIPCVFYTGTGENVPIQASAKEISKLYDQVGRTTVFNIEIDDNGKKVTKPALIWDVQFHPVKHSFTHIDFYGVDLEKEVKIVVPLEFLGTAKGTKLGGKLETYREQVRVQGKPLDIPAKISVDISNLDINETLHVSDLNLPAGVKAHTDSHFAIVSVISREAVEAESAEAQGEAATTAES